MAMRICRLINLFVLLVFASSAPLNPPSAHQNHRHTVGRKPRKAHYFDNIMEYLTEFGYLPESDRETGNLRTDQQLRDAVKNLQHFGNIEETGELDEATLRLMARPRCGLPDIQSTNYSRKKRYTVHGQKWHYTNLTWSLRTWHLNRLDRNKLRGDLSKALSVWSKHSRLTFQEINSDTADILVYFETGYHGDGYPFDGRGQILAHAFFPGSGRGGDAHFDIDELWLLSGDLKRNQYEDGDNGDEGTSLLAVAAHEFGHSLGLSHSSVPGALMYPWYQGLKDDFELPDDDKHGIQQIYGNKGGKEWGKNVFSKGGTNRWPMRPGWHTPPTTTSTSTTTTTRRPPTTVTTRRTTPRPVTPPHNDKPDTCDTVYDAISVIRREMFIFRNEYIWRIGDKGLYPGYPALTKRLWNSLPSNFTRVDAVYERLDKKIVFFIGKLYYVFNGNQLEVDSPLPLTHLGLPRTLEKIDAAMVWGHNSKTYLFSGTMYWRLDEDIGRVELDYPRDMSVWKGVGYGIDSVFQWSDGATYFFKGKGYWKFNDLRMRVEHTEPKRSAEFWMGCPASPTENPNVNSVDDPGGGRDRFRGNGNGVIVDGGCIHSLSSFCILSLTIFYAFLFSTNLYP